MTSLRRSRFARTVCSETLPIRFTNAAFQPAMFFWPTGALPSCCACDCIVQLVSASEMAATSHHYAAVYAEYLAGNVTCLRGREKGYATRDIFRLARSAERNFRVNRLLDFLRESSGHIRHDKARRNSIHGDVAAGQFARERLSETNQAGLARRVIGLARVPDHSDHGTDVNDATAALFDHHAFCGLHKVESAFQVRVDHHVPVFHRHAQTQSGAPHAGVVDQDVDLAEIIENLRADLLYGGMIRDIDRVSFRRVRPCRVDFSRR